LTEGKQGNEGTRVARDISMSTFDYFLIGLLVGVAITAAVGAYLHRRSATRLRLRGLIQDNMEALWTLKALRSGDMDKALDFAESSLTLAVIMLGAEMHYAPVLRQDPDLLLHIRQAKEYRDKYPHKSKIEGEDWNLARTFALVDNAA